VITARIPSFSGAAVHVRLEDISYADRAADLVAEQVIVPVRHPSATTDTAEIGDTSIAFVLEGDVGTIDPEADYGVRVWVDMDGDGAPGPNDLHSNQSYRVLTKGFGNHVVIALTPSSGARE
jgi:uncharacterized lipoprotein YbaY